MKKNKASGIFAKKKALSASLRIMIPLYTTYVIFALSIFLIFVPMLKNHMMEQKKELIQNITQSTWNLLSNFDRKVKQGELTLEEAQKKAKNQIQNFRYGPEGKDYFWIINMQNKVLMHPYRPDMEGESQTTIKDSEGKQLWRSMVEKVKIKGSGYISYKWQWKDDPSKIVPKISFVKGFLPWDWVIGTGLYIDDVRSEIRLITRGFVKIFIWVLVIVILMSFYIAWQVVKIEKKKNLAQMEKHLEELRLKKLLQLNQMSGTSLNKLTEFALEEAIKLTQSDIGYLAFLDENETELTMHTWSKHAMKKCDIIDKSLVYQVEETGQWG
ncbi:MAG: histidine kinase, partial [Desulfobacteraceae bacterium]|nr:histidine kinase [Desulfobacteraceae bacterium]